MTSAKITIITPCLNRANFIRDAIESVLAQDYKKIEHIIVDGGSTDGTLELIASYPYLKVISGPDKGLYDAVNKGLQQAHGEIIGLLNSDDFYESDIFKPVVALFQSNPDTDVVIGKATVLSEMKQGSREEFYPTISSQNITKIIIQGAPIINAWFFRKKVFDQVGLFDLNYPIAADRDFLIRLNMQDIKFSFFERVVYHYRQHAQSLTITHNSQSQTKVLLENLILAEYYLKQDFANSSYKALLREWHDLTAVELFLRFVRQIEFAKATTIIELGTRFNHEWYSVLTTQIWLRSKEKLQKWFQPLA